MDIAAEEVDEFAAALPGCDLTHQFQIVSDDKVQTVIAILQELYEVDGRLKRLLSAAAGKEICHEIRIAGLSPQVARRVSGKLAVVPGVYRAAVEHRLGRAEWT